MFRCKIVRFLFSMIPLKVWQDFLIHSHVYKCEECRSMLASPDEVKAVLFQESDVENFLEIWPSVRAGIRKKRVEKNTFFPLNWKGALTTAGFMVLILAGVLFYSALVPKGGLEKQALEEKFRINSIRVGNEPATPFLYQPQNSDMIIVWAERNL